LNQITEVILIFALHNDKIHFTT